MIRNKPTRAEINDFVDAALSDRGLRRVLVHADGLCFFRCIVNGLRMLGFDQVPPLNVLQETLLKFRSREAEALERIAYQGEGDAPEVWGGHVDLLVAMDLYHFKAVVHQHYFSKDHTLEYQSYELFGSRASDLTASEKQDLPTLHLVFQPEYPEHWDYAVPTEEAEEWEDEDSGEFEDEDDWEQDLSQTSSGNQPGQPNLESIQKKLKELLDLQKSGIPITFAQFKEAISIVAQLNSPIFEQCKKITYNELIASGKLKELRTALNKLVGDNLKSNKESHFNYECLSRLVRNLARKDSNE